MAKSVTIVYTGPIVDEIRKGMNIASVFEPANSYIDTPVFTEGFDNTDLQLGDKESYGKSIYATNVWGLGALHGLIPMNSTTVKFAEFERAIFAAKEAEAAGEENQGVTFEIEGYQEELYWEQIARGMDGLGFTVTISDGGES